MNEWVLFGFKSWSFVLWVESVHAWCKVIYWFAWSGPSKIQGQFPTAHKQTNKQKITSTANWSVKKFQSPLLPHKIWKKMLTSVPRYSTIQFRSYTCPGPAESVWRQPVTHNIISIITELKAGMYERKHPHPYTHCTLWLCQPATSMCADWSQPSLSIHTQECLHSLQMPPNNILSWVTLHRSNIFFLILWTT